MERYGWVKGEHFIMLDIDVHPDAYNAAGRPALPTSIRYEDGKEVARVVGPMTASQMAEFYYGRPLK